MSFRHLKNKWQLSSYGTLQCELVPVWPHRHHVHGNHAAKSSGSANDGGFPQTFSVHFKPTSDGDSWQNKNLQRCFREIKNIKSIKSWFARCINRERERYAYAGGFLSDSRTHSQSNAPKAKCGIWTVRPFTSTHLIVRTWHVSKVRLQQVEIPKR